jgi:hypothetical protein
MDQSSQASGLVDIPVKFTAGASGAVPALSAFAQHNGVAAVTKPSGTGIYKITLEDAYLARVGFIRDVKQASYSSSGACHIQITADTTSDPTDPSVTLLVTTAAGAAVNLASGDVVTITLVMQYLDANS